MIGTCMYQLSSQIREQIARLLSKAQPKPTPIVAQLLIMRNMNNNLPPRPPSLQRLKRLPYLLKLKRRVNNSP